MGSGMHLGRVTSAGTQTSLAQKLLVCLFFFPNLVNASVRL